MSMKHLDLRVLCVQNCPSLQKRRYCVPLPNSRLIAFKVQGHWPRHSRRGSQMNRAPPYLQLSARNRVNPQTVILSTHPENPFVATHPVTPSNTSPSFSET